MKKFILFLCSSVLSIGLYAQNLDTKNLDEYLNAYQDNDKFMGSVALMKGGNIIYERSIGFSDVNAKKKNDPQTKFRIGSISKTFTATLVMKAVEEQKLSLTTSLSTFFPEIKNATKINIKQLLMHRSGINNFTNDKNFMNWLDQKKTKDELVKIIKEGGSDFEPDTKSDYSNSNYVLLTFILEKVYQKTYPQLLEQYITKPLNLLSTKYGAKINPNQNESYSYTYNGIWEKQKESDMSIPQGAGAIVSTPSDILKFAHALFNYKIVKKESVDQMKTVLDGYGFGLITFPYNNQTVYGHTGGIDGFSSMFGTILENDIYFAWTTNGVNCNMNDVSISLVKSLLGEKLEIPKFKTIAISSSELDQYVGVYATTKVPLKITISNNNGQLMAQGTGQSSFPIEYKGDHTFEFSPANIKLVFNPQLSNFTLFQGGEEVVFTKEN